MYVHLVESLYKKATYTYIYIIYVYNWKIYQFDIITSVTSQPPRVSAAVHAQDAAHEMVANDLVSKGGYCRCDKASSCTNQLGWKDPQKTCLIIIHWFTVEIRDHSSCKTMQNPQDVFLAPVFVAAPNAVVKASVLSKGSDLCVLMTLRMVKAKKQTNRCIMWRMLLM